MADGVKEGKRRKHFSGKNRMSNAQDKIISLDYVVLA
jgi:hypothetical protein